MAVLPVHARPGARLGHRPPGRHRPGHRVGGEAARPMSSSTPLRLPADWLERRGIGGAGPGVTWPTWASTCSIATALLDLLRCQPRGHRLRQRRSFRAASRTQPVQAHLFDGYWEDLGTISPITRRTWPWPSDQPPFDFHSPEGVIYTRDAILAGLAGQRRHAGTMSHQRRLRDRRGHAHRPLRRRRPQPRSAAT